MWFFNRSNFLIDYLDGVKDIHNHLLPTLDDGSTDIATTKEMIRMMRECNISQAIATPHIMEDFYNLDKQTIAGCYNSTLRELNPEDQYFLTGFAAEYMIDHSFINMSCHRNLLLINDKYALTEFSYFQKPDFVEEVAFNLRTIDVVPILAHPERYNYIKHIDEFKALKERGFVFQLNLLAISGHYGAGVRKNAYMLLENDLYDFVGTDAHKKDHLEVLKISKIGNKYERKFKQLIADHQEKLTPAY